MNYVSSFDVNKEVKVFQEIGSEEWNRDRSKLECPSINLGFGTARKS